MKFKDLVKSVDDCRYQDQELSDKDKINEALHCLGMIREWCNTSGDDEFLKDCILKINELAHECQEKIKP